MRFCHNRWEADEVSYLDYQDKSKRGRRNGFKKIEMTCNQAQKDQLEYAWVDTCCIDKASSAELSEGINSMFNWYRDASICYAYLSDVPKGDDPRSNSSRFCKSLWFTRGWTLQELIAPTKLGFYGADWSKIGEKADLIPELQSLTSINAEILAGAPLNTICVAKRMSWAASRRTTREEDIAYCLMGIFSVNMPMLYGEGSQAFIRLQEEIWKETEDQSLFAWRATPESEKEAPYRGIMASSPDEFVDCDDIVPFPTFSVGNVAMGITNRGVPLTTASNPSGKNTCVDI